VTTQAEAPLPDKLALSYREVCRALGLCRSTVAKMVSMGEFPAPRAVGARQLFVTREIVAWLEALPRVQR